jgi:hypothetical protein
MLTRENTRAYFIIVQMPIAMKKFYQPEGIVDVELLGEFCCAEGHEAIHVVLVADANKGFRWFGGLRQLVIVHKVDHLLDDSRLKIVDFIGAGPLPVEVSLEDRRPDGQDSAMTTGANVIKLFTTVRYDFS